jgi:hypothetical protein
VQHGQALAVHQEQEGGGFAGVLAQAAQHRAGNPLERRGALGQLAKRSEPNTQSEEPGLLVTVEKSGGRDLSQQPIGRAARARQERRGFEYRDLRPLQGEESQYLVELLEHEWFCSVGAAVG